ncbi:MAG: PocR ligand-binding domain-containing protein [Victivallales bacterium]|nr:PocR ligand-binding domain-containing protein [Victivallales bacterium]
MLVLAAAVAAAYYWPHFPVIALWLPAGILLAGVAWWDKNPKASKSSGGGFCRSLLKSRSMVIFSGDRNGMIRLFNAGAEQLLGYKAEELVNRENVLFLCDPEMLPSRLGDKGVAPTPEVFSLLLRDGKTGPFAWTLKRKTGVPVSVLLTLSPRLGFHGHRDGFVAMAALNQGHDGLLRDVSATALPDIDATGAKPEIEPDKLELAGIIDPAIIQPLMDDFGRLTGMTMAIFDLENRTVVATGLQDICVNFHRRNPLTAAFCNESGLEQVRHLKEGEYSSYYCKNHLHDVIMPLYIGGRHVGNIFTGQFFYDDEKVDERVFIAHADKYGFDRREYLEALHRVPRFSHDRVATLIDYLTRFTAYISQLSFRNLQLGRAVECYRDTRDQLQRQYLFLQQLIDAIPNPVFYKDTSGRYLGCNLLFQQEIGLEKEQIVGRTAADIFPAKEAALFSSLDRKLFESPGIHSFETSYTVKEGQIKNIIINKATYLNPDRTVGGLIAVSVDITARKRGEEERVRLQEELNRAQKMESIGRLAGGVAHDFNNMLQVIIGYTDFALHNLDPDNAVYRSLQQALSAARQSSILTRQLLAFARKQVIRPVVLDLNAVVAGMTTMLRQLVGDDVVLEWTPGHDLWPVKMDPSQIDQIMTTLTVNAREAMPAGGRLNIATVDVTIDAAYCSHGRDFLPGEYVMLSLTDNGCGMDKETVDRLFEPFFTTKMLGNGAGLGLSTIFGAVRQNNGFIHVYSEPGHGTTFKIYLPHCRDPLAVQEPELRTELTPAWYGGSETILLAEDDPAILALGKYLLEQHGYTVIAADSPATALKLAADHPTPIHLLISDVVMPQMNGKMLWDQLAATRPGLKVIYMSGYPAEVITHHGIIDTGVEFMPKPFSEESMLATVRKVLDAVPDSATVTAPKQA